MEQSQDSSGIDEGLYYFTIDVKDVIGSVTGLSNLENNAIFGLDKTAPEVKILNPVSNSSFNSDFTISGTASDKVFLERVEVYINESLLGNAVLGADNTWSFLVPVSYNFV